MDFSVYVDAVPCNTAGTAAYKKLGYGDRAQSRNMIRQWLYDNGLSLNGNNSGERPPAIHVPNIEVLRIPLQQVSEIHTASVTCQPKISSGLDFVQSHYITSTTTKCEMLDFSSESLVNPNSILRTDENLHTIEYNHSSECGKESNPVKSPFYDNIPLHFSPLSDVISRDTSDYVSILSSHSPIPSRDTTLRMLNYKGVLSTLGQECRVVLLCYITNTWMDLPVTFTVVQNLVFDPGILLDPT